MAKLNKKEILLRLITPPKTIKGPFWSREYKILKNVDKLGYFYSEEYGYFCHLCLMEYIEINRKSGENLPIIIKTKDSQVKL